MKSENISNNELDELIEISFEQAKRICTCKNCYREKATPLIFPMLEQQKVVLISESPYNFPPPEIIERREFHWTKYFKEDFKCFIYCELGPYLVSPRSQGIPENIFDFISLIFYPLLRECKSKEEGIKIFLNNVYWTHMGKRSLKGLKGNSEKGAVAKCLNVLLEELEEKASHNVKLFVICTRYFPKLLLGVSISEILFKHQGERIRKGELLTVDEVITLAKTKKYKETLELFKDSYISFFPNPSRRNAPLNKCFSTREDTKSLLNFIHNLLLHEIHL